MSEDHSSSPESSQDRRRQWRRQEDRRLLQRERELEVARRVCQTLFNQINPDKLIEQALCSALDVVNAEAGSILIADQEMRMLVFRHVVGQKAHLLRGTAIPWDTGIAGAVFSTAEPEIVPDVRKDPRHYQAIDALTGFKTRDMIVMPLMQWGGQPIGVLEVLNKRQGYLNQEDVAILTIISALSTAAIEQTRLFEEAKLAEVIHRLGDISHDVSNLLNPVILSASIVRGEIDKLLAELKEDERDSTVKSLRLCKDASGTLRDSVRRIRDRMQEVTDCLRGMHNPPRFSPCQVEDVVDQVVKALGFLAEQRGIKLIREGLESVPPILADEQRLYTVFYNLINNAIPEIPKGGSVTIRGQVDSPAGQVLLSVSDTGRGMPSEVRDSLFTGHAISRKPGGTGLGTKIVKDVVDAHGGTIMVESAEGEGTTFYLRLPFRQSDAQAT